MAGAVASTRVAKEFVSMAAGWDPSDPPLTPLKLMKMTYIAHGWHLGAYDENLISEDVYAWKHGPVFPSLYNSIQHYRRNKVTSVKSNLNERKSAAKEENKISKKGTRIIEIVNNSYKRFTGGKLSGMTHMEGTPWDEVTEMYGIRRGLIIPRNLIRDYYADKLSSN